MMTDLRPKTQDSRQKGSKKRASGILLPIRSLPSNYGIGDLGKGAYQFADFLSK